MEIVRDFINNELTLFLPVVVVFAGAVLLYTFGFKSAEQPPFDKLTNDDRKQAGKRKKLKEKKITANGHVSSGEPKTEKSPVKDKRSPIKETVEVAPKQKDRKSDNKQTEKNKKNEAIKSKVIEEVKNKKNVKRVVNEKPVDFDDGNWETVPSKGEKKKKPEQSPVKKDNKKSNKKAIEIEKLVKEVVNKELREKEKEVIIEKPVEEPVIEEEPVVVIEEKKEKKKEKKPKKESVEKQVVEEIPGENETSKPKVEKISQPIREESPKPPAKETTLVFDELGDVWTEAKAAKKSKKKTRRDN